MKIRVATRRKGERGQTLALVAVSLVSLLGLAALAIDVSALYVARSEAQSAADAAALAGARMFATSSFSSVPGSFGVPTEVCAAGAGSPAAVNKAAVAAAQENSISNQPATVTSITCNLLQDGNPQVTVVVKRNNLTTFLSRIWSSTIVSTSATATAEAYNASGQDVAIEVTGGKPWLLPNCDPDNTAAPNPNCPGGGTASYFVNSGSGMIANNGVFLGRALPSHFTRLRLADPIAVGSFHTIDLGPPSNVCPSGASPSCNLGANNYEDNIACSSQVKMSCGQNVGLGSPTPVINGTGTSQGTRCLIHADNNGPGQGQDKFVASGAPPVRIDGEYNNANAALRGIDNISRSDSVVTLPLYDPLLNPRTQSVPIIGFLQLGVTETATGGSFYAVVLNAVGCKPGAGGPLASAGNTSPVGVRLIQP